MISLNSRKKLRIGTRGSQLALWQANWIRRQIKEKYPDIDIEQIIIKTTGDLIQNRALSEIGGKGLFVKELESALLDNQIDLAVHSMKDVPSFIPDGLDISVITKREDPSDVLIAPGYDSLASLPQGAKVGTSSLRRAAQLIHYRSDLVIEPLRGNVDTRLRKVKEGQYAATVLAMAGLKRLNRDDEITERLPFSVMLPAIAQGAIGIETRNEDKQTIPYIEHLHDPSTTDCITAERTLLTILEGNCRTPLAGHCQQNGENLELKTLISYPDGTNFVRFEATAPRSQARKLGEQAAAYLLENGGKEILDQLQS